MNVMVVENGIAGNEVAFPVRLKDAAAGITIVSAESGPEYDPCSLP